MAKATRRSGYIAAALATAVLVPSPAPAQDKTRIPKSESKLVLDMPGLKGGVEVFQYFGWNSNYTFETHYAAQVSKSALYPRAQVYYKKLAPAQRWSSEKPIDEATIRASATFFKGKKLNVTQSDTGSGNRERRYARFEVDGADCVSFSVIAGSYGSSSSGGYNVHGFYCGAIGAKLTEADIAAVFAGWRLLP